MKEEIQVSNSTLLVEQEENVDHVAVVFLPGMSGGAHTERFLSTAQVILESGHTSVRLRAWEGEVDVKTKTLRWFYTEIEAVINYLLENGFEEIVLIGKSFGGGLVLAYEHPQVVQKIMWAPAIGISDKETISPILDMNLGQVDSLLDICVSFEDVKTDDAMLSIIHGTNDTVIPLHNSEKIINAAERGSLHGIEGADHSFKDALHEAELLKITKKLLELKNK